jgi:hypothetical protein
MNVGKSFKMKSLQTLILQSKAPDQVPVPKPKQKKSVKEVKKSEQKKKKPYRKQKISAALREQVWVQHNGPVFQKKCAVTWCKNIITVFNFQCGHDIPESKGGPTNITNLYPICGKCNISMSNTYTFKEWCVLYESKEPQVEEPLPQPIPIQSFWKRYFCCWRR